MNLLFITSPKGSAIKKEPYDLNYCTEKTLQRTLLWELTKHFIWALISKTKIILSFKKRKTTIATTTKETTPATYHSAICKCDPGTYRIKIGEEVDCSRSVQRKGKKGFDIQRRLQRRGWWTDQGWESGALACTTCREESKGSHQRHCAC